MLACQPCGTGSAPLYTSAAAPGAGEGCGGQVVRTGYRTETVDCPTTRAVQERITIPRQVTSSRIEQRARTRIVNRTRQVPVTKYRTETKMVPVQRQVAYKDFETQSYQQPVTENFAVTVPETKITYENRTRTRFVPSTKKCQVKVPVYGARCDRAARVTSAAPQYVTSAAPQYVTSAAPVLIDNGGLIGTSSAIPVSYAAPVSYGSAGYATSAPAGYGVAGFDNPEGRIGEIVGE